MERRLSRFRGDAHATEFPIPVGNGNCRDLFRSQDSCVENFPGPFRAPTMIRLASRFGAMTKHHKSPTPMPALAGERFD